MKQTQKYTEHHCIFCKKTWDTTKTGFSRHVMYCKKNPNCIEVPLGMRSSPLLSKKEYQCKFCEKTWNTTKEGCTLHEKHCKENPNRVHGTFKGKTHTQETKNKLSDATKKTIERFNKEGKPWGFALNHGAKERSYPEKWWLQVIKNEFNDKNVTEQFPFYTYSLDFAWPHKHLCIEINGGQHYTLKDRIANDKRKEQKLIENGWQVLWINWSECSVDKKQWIEIAKKFIDNGEIIPFEKRYKTKKEKYDERKLLYKDYHFNKNGKIIAWNKFSEEIWHDRLRLLEKYDKTVYGWIAKASKETKLTKKQIHLTCDHFDIEWRTKKK